MTSPKSAPRPDRLAALARVLKLVRETDDFAQAVSALLEALHDAFDYTVLWLGHYDRALQQVLSLDYIAPRPHQSLEAAFPLASGDLLEQVLMQQRPLLVNDLRVESRVGRWNAIAQDLDIQGALLFPLRRRDTCHGLMLLGTPHWGNTVDSQDRPFLSTVGGTLADLLHQQEQQSQAQALKAPGTALAALVQTLKTIPEGDGQLRAISQALLHFIEPDRVRIFGLAAAELTFWERLRLEPGRAPSEYSAEAASLTVGAADMGGGYQVLNSRQPLVRGESQSSLVANVPEKFLQTLRAEALMLAPLFHHETLTGFISIEGKSPRVWSEADQDFLSTVATLAGLLLPGTGIEAVKQQARADLQLLTGLVHRIQTDTDLHETLQWGGHELLQRLAGQHFCVLRYAPEQAGYRLVSYTAAVPQKTPPRHWHALAEVDWQMLERSAGAIAVSDLEADLKLITWKEHFQALQARSVLTCSVSSGDTPEGIVLVTSPTPRYWNASEARLLERVAQQVGLILHQWRLQQQADHQEDLHSSLQWGFQALQQTTELDQLEEAANRHLITLLKIPLVALVSWQVGQADASAQRTLSHHSEFSVAPEAAIAVETDSAIQRALQCNGHVLVAWEALSEETQRWITCPPGSTCVLVALRTASSHPPSGMWLLATPPDYVWTGQTLALVQLLANQLAWSRRHLNLVGTLATHRTTLSTLNWYKHQHLGELHRQLKLVSQRLSDPVTQGNGLTAQRQLQVVREVDTLAAGLQSVVEQEAWQLDDSHQTTPLAGLIKRLMERVTPLIEAKQLWAKVHDSSNVLVSGNLDKIEFVLCEIAAAACRRSPEQGHLDIWCQPLDRHWIELLMTDDGAVPESLLKALQNDSIEDPLSFSPLDCSPGVHLAICQILMAQMGGGFSLQALEDGRTASRILLAIAPKRPAKQRLKP